MLINVTHAPVISGDSFCGIAIIALEQHLEVTPGSSLGFVSVEHLTAAQAHILCRSRHKLEWPHCSGF
ncbi:hypothetical protein D3C76_1442370 [compost metagenome]